MMNRSLRSSRILAIVAVTTALAVAAPARAEPDLPRVSVTVSPLHLILPMGEVTAELRLADKLGVAVIAGAGGVRDRDTDQRIRVFEGGASARYYVTGSFRTGAQLGAEALYVYADAGAGAMTTISAEGLGLSPFAGYKWTHRSGLTLEGQAGVTFLVARGTADPDTEKRAIGPLLNLQLGYGF